MTRTPEQLAGKVAVVTGAARGIGAAAARSLAREGAIVGLLDVDAAGVARIGEAIQADGGRALALPADVRDEREVAGAVERMAAEHGGIDLLASFAGVVGYAPAPELAVGEWDRVVDVNAKGAYLCVKHAVPWMRRRGGGAIVLTSSIMAFASDATTLAYAASKGAVAAMTNAIALDHAAEGIRVNCIVPGVIRTELLTDAAARSGTADPDALVDSWGRRHPIGRVIEPDEVVELVLFLLSDRASAITGSAHRVDGGLLSRLG